MLATGFVADTPAEGTTFPSGGGDSGDPRVQAVYWRCIAVLFAGARYADPGLRLALFANVAPPVVDGVELGAVLARLGVEVRRVPLAARLAPGRTRAWGNVLYFLDVFDSLDAEPDDLRVAFVDGDVVVSAPLAPLFALLDAHEFAGYVVETGADEDVNGMTPRAMAAAARDLDGIARTTVAHFGGELLLVSLGAWRRHRATFRALFARAAGDPGAAGAIRTEEHLFSIVFATLGARVARANALIKRIWTSARVNTAAPGDERLPLWHLPAEKRYGLRDLFADLARRGFPDAMAPDDFRKMALARCGLPRKSLYKLGHDGVRQVASKLSLRK